jgi:exodeoxyribonuclease V beta subunit
VTLLEASAGTGKTFAIAALVARYVAEGVPLGQLLVVTFTRMATGELRERVRERLVSAEAGLDRTLAGAPLPVDDPVLGLLATGDGSEVRKRQLRLGSAVANFDAATIATTHGFCQHALAGLGVTGDVERDVTFVEDLSDLVEEVVDDLYVRRFRNVRRPPFNRQQALQVGRAAVANTYARIEPFAQDPKDEEQNWAMRGRLALAVRREIEVRKRRSGVMTYDDLLTRLRDTLADEEQGASARQRLRERYAVALVDEFQDTDPVQWEIMRRAFGDSDGALVLIGDPKQAIYSFRGADVYAYLDAARSAATSETLATNWRSDERLIEAFDALFGTAQLGHEGIRHAPVRAADANRSPRLLDAPVTAPLRVRILRRDSGIIPLTRYGFAAKRASEEAIAADLAGDVVSLLSSSATLVERALDGSERGRDPVQPRHVAVLVPTNRLAGLVDQALEHAGVPAVVNGAGSVFATPEAEHWLRLLEVLERPASGTRARAAALTLFVGWDAARTAAAEEGDWEVFHAKLHRWAGVLARRGVAGLLESISGSEKLQRRVLERVGGERRLTNLRHLGQLLHAVASEQELGVASLTAWLRQRVADADRDSATEDRTLRLDSDAEAVQVLTVHRSKGLEFPIVYAPFPWQPSYIDRYAPPAYHDDQKNDVWTIDVGGDGPGINHHRRLELQEQRGEDLRLLYVALTRTMHQATVWWAGSQESRDSALGRLLFAQESDGTIASQGTATPDDDDFVARVEALADQAPGRISVETVRATPDLRWAGRPRPPTELDARRFDRALDRHWRRVSYSSITEDAREEQVATEPEETVLNDESLLPAPTVDEEASIEEDILRSEPLVLSAMPGGADVGDLVHRVLETADFASTDLDRELEARLAEQQGRGYADLGDRATVITGLSEALRTPLGPLLGEARLCEVHRSDRLDELNFELPLVGGDSPSGTLSLADVADLLDKHLSSADPLAGYAARLRDPLLHWDVRGYLTGILDLVVRTRDADGRVRYALVDYKTNWLGVDGEVLSAWHYRPAALADAMQRAHYVLQALLYVAALHRYLRGRVPGYDPDIHLAGVLYLFVRGMTGAATPRVDGLPCGVFAWRPPKPLVEDLSDLLDRGAFDR